MFLQKLLGKISAKKLAGLNLFCIIYTSEIEYDLQGRVKFPTGGNAAKAVSPRAYADPVRFRGRQ